MTDCTRRLPVLETLTWDQSAGRACVWCKRPLVTGAVSAGTIHDRDGAHVLDTEVWACPPCDAGERPAERLPPRPPAPWGTAAESATPQPAEGDLR